MPLNKGPASIRGNMKELMNTVENPARERAIRTIMKKHNISHQEAQYRQAIQIAKRQARTK